MSEQAAAAFEGQCPVCRFGTASQLYSVTSRQAAQHFVRRGLDPEKHEAMVREIERLWSGPTNRLYRCETCEFCFCWPFVAGGEGFYKLLLSTPSYPSDRFEFHQTLQALQGRPASAAPLKLLEIGAGDGPFIRMVSPALAEKGNIVCTEFSPAAAQAVRDYGVTCLQADFRQIDRSEYGGRFNAICLFQVLEHLDHVDDTWQSLSELASAGAELFISTPSEKWVDFAESHGGELDMPPNHVGRWNPRCFETIASRYGWELVRHAYEPIGRLTLLNQMASSRFFAARSRPDSLTDRSTRLQSRPMRRAASLPMMGIAYARSLATALTADPRALGAAQWAHLRRR